MIIESNTGNHKLIEDWAKILDTPIGRENDRTHGIDE